MKNGGMDNGHKKETANHERKQPQKLVYISDLHENG
jgi:hypothetical protein